MESLPELCCCFVIFTDFWPFNEVWLIYSIVLISAEQQSDSVRHIIRTSVLYIPSHYGLSQETGCSSWCHTFEFACLVLNSTNVLTFSGAKPEASASYPPGGSICVGDWDVIAPTPDYNTPPRSSRCWDLVASRRNLERPAVGRAGPV